MPATIRIESGISAGTSCWIDRPVLRIGSDPQCDVCLPSAELAPHAVTLEFRDGNYRVYNRSSLPVAVGAASLKPGENGIWRGNETLQLPGGLRLGLQIDGDPRPTPRPELRTDDGDGFDNRAGATPADAIGPTDATDAASPKKSSGTTVQMAVIGICALASVAFLLMRGGDDTAIAADRPSFEAIVQESLSKDAAYRAVVRRLQYAQAALVRGHYPLARERFLKLRDQLIKQVESLPQEGRGDIERILSYVEFRLGQLQ